jgi:hypothetical protein
MISESRRESSRSVNPNSCGAGSYFVAQPARDRLLPRRIRPQRFNWSAIGGERLPEGTQVCTRVLRSEPKRPGEQGLGVHKRTGIGAVPQVLEPLRHIIGGEIKSDDQLLLPFG